MDLFQAMRVFVRVVETGSFTAAARSLNVSTAHISRSIADLEASVKARLLQRTTRSQSLTEVGTRYLQSCRDILARVEEAGSEASASCLQPQGCLRVHSVTEFGLECLLPLAVEYSRLWPQAHLDLTLGRQPAHLIDDHFDVLITLSSALPNSELVGQRLASFRSVVCASPAYLAANGTPIVPANLRHHTCLRLTDSMFPDSWSFDSPNGEVVVDPGDTFKVNHSQALAFTAAAGMGICVLPSFVAAPAFVQGSLVRILPDYQLHPRNVYAVYSSRKFLDAKISAWIELLKGQLPHQLASHLATVNAPRYWVGRQGLARARPVLASEPSPLANPPRFHGSAPVLPPPREATPVKRQGLT